MNLCRLSLVSRHISLRFYSLSAKKMTRGSGDVDRLSRGGRSGLGGDSAIRSKLVETSGSFCNDKLKQIASSSPRNMYKKRNDQEKYPTELEGGDSQEIFKGSSYDEEFPPLGVSLSASSKDKPFGKISNRVDLGLDLRKEAAKSSQPERLQSPNGTSHRNEFTLPIQLGKRKKFPSEQRNHRNSADKNKNGSPSHGLSKPVPFDIFLVKDRYSGLRKASWVMKKEIQEETEQTIEVTKRKVLRPGMVLLRHYFTHDEQIEVVRTCRRLGIGPGGFYQPGYKDGAKLRLWMMCLGLNWDPETKYEGQKAGKDSKCPDIPRSFIFLVQRAIRDAHALMKMDSGAGNVENMIPSMSPDICIANFYTTTGRLGLHQDRDESRTSIQKGLPVVSFSIGDSAEFLYGERRHMERAEKVILESGDVLMFGGESRLIFHGVTSIIPNSAPKALLDKTNLRPGRLNLTFRQY